jgi:mono/diheme cytochrome c family protein
MRLGGPQHALADSRPMQWWPRLLILVGLAGCRSSATAVPTPLRTPMTATQAAGSDIHLPAYRFSLRHGSRIYSAECASCHGATGAGDGSAAPFMNPRPTNFRDREYMRRQRLDYYYRAVTRGVPGTNMLGWESELDGQTRWDVSAYVWSLSGGRHLCQRMRRLPRIRRYRRGGCQLSRSIPPGTVVTRSGLRAAGYVCHSRVDCVARPR